MNKIIAASLLAIGLMPVSAPAQVVVRVAPPRVVVERRIPPPGPRYVWVAGYHRWNGVRYVWVPGRYVLPPRLAAVWVPAHWVPRRDGWVFIAGYWR